ncbi:folylpolyglutamate synthase, partial [Phlyctochytrium arcticum]
IDLGLERVGHLLARLGNPQSSYPVIHVAGTNGKGSVVAMISSIMSAAGYRTGRFNSPHLIGPHDVVRINDKVIHQDSWAKAYGSVLYINEEHSIGASLFEVSTATAFVYFAEEKVDIAVLEVGLGGRLDATNICDPPLVCVFTSIGLDHVEFLGDTIEKIAREKAGIIKKGTRVVVGPQSEVDVLPVIRDMAENKGCACSMVDACSRVTASTETQLGLLGDFQLSNAATAVKAVEVLGSIEGCSFRVSTDSVVTGLAKLRWPGRLEWVNVPSFGELLVDGAHNPPAATALATYIDSIRKTRGPTCCWIVGFTSGKDVKGVLKCLLRRGDFVCTVPFTRPQQMPWVQCMSPDALAKSVREAHSDLAQVEQFESLDTCMSHIEALPSRPSTVILAGSLYLVADLYRRYSLPI